MLDLDTVGRTRIEGAPTVQQTGPAPGAALTTDAGEPITDDAGAYVTEG